MRRCTRADGGESEADDVDPEDATADHLDDVGAGCGCAEIWEHLSEQRAEDDEDEYGDRCDRSDRR